MYGNWHIYTCILGLLGFQLYRSSVRMVILFELIALNQVSHQNGVHEFLRAHAAHQLDTTWIYSTIHWLIY